MENNNHVHVFKDYIVPSTCKENGYTLHKCDCGYEHKDNFRPLSGHSFVLASETAPTCTQNGSRLVRCTVCGEEKIETIPFLGHSWGGWQIQKFPTCTEEGAKMRICTRCGIKEEESVPATGHKLTGAKKGKDSIEYLCANCGQTISRPTSSANAKKFLSSHKKSIIATVTSMVLVVALLVATFTLFIPLYHYSAAVKAIESGDYTEAYNSLKKCNGIKDSKELIKDFVVFYGEEICTDIDYDYFGNEDDSSTYKNNTEFEFYESGMLKSRTVANLDDGVDYIYKYDEKGNLTYDAWYFYGLDDEPSGETEYKYDEKGNIILSVEYNQYDEISEKTEYEYKYDENDNIILALCYDSYGKVKSKTENTYDKNNNMTLSVVYDSNGDVTDETEYKYSLNGNMKSVVNTTYDSYGNVESKKVYKYKCDKSGTVKSYDWTTYNEYDNVERVGKGECNQYGNIVVEVEYESDRDVRDRTIHEYFNPQIVYAPKNK